MRDPFLRLEENLNAFQRVGLMAALRPGLSPQEIEQRVGQAGIPLGGAVKSLFSWRDGLEQSPLDIGEAYLYPGMYLMTLTSALEIRAECSQLSNWSQNWLPILMDGGGGYLVIDSSADMVDSPIFTFEASWDEAPSVFDSFQLMLHTISEGYEQDIFFVDSKGHLDYQGENFDDLAKQLNPASRYWAEP